MPNELCAYSGLPMYVNRISKNMMYDVTVTSLQKVMENMKLQNHQNYWVFHKQFTRWFENRKKDYFKVKFVLISLSSFFLKN